MAPILRQLRHQLQAHQAIPRAHRRHHRHRHHQVHRRRLQVETEDS